MRETFWQRLLRGVRRLHQQPYWPHFAGADWADRIMAVSATDRFHAKQGRTIARWALEAQGRRLTVYLKRHYRLAWWRGLLALLHPGRPWSPALQEWEHLEWARGHGLPVPVVAAVGEYVGPWGRLQSVLAVEELADMLPLHQAVPAAARRLSRAAFRLWKRGLVEEMAALTLALHRRHRFHKDLYLCHFYIAEADTRCVPDWRGRVRMIDFHRLGHHPWTGPYWRCKDLAQLLYSSEVDGVDVRDRLHFWRVYRRGADLGRRAEWLRWWVRLRGWNYRRRSRRRRARAAKAALRSPSPLVGVGGGGG
jgi:heptose I phosphotransferase